MSTSTMLCSIIAVLLILFCQTEAATYYVSGSTGLDTNAGTLIAPYKTISKCAAVAVGGDTCTIRAGTYRETVTLTRDSVTFNNYGTEVVTVSGADVVTSAWTLYSGNIWKTTFSLHAAFRDSATGIADNALYVDGVLMPTARWPNINASTLIAQNFSNSYSTIATVSAVTGTTKVSLSDPLLASAVSFNMSGKAKCTASFALMYYTGTCIVTSGGNSKANFSIDCAGRNGFPDQDLTRDDNAPAVNNQYYLYDNLGFLDYPGEWYYDNSTDTLYAYMPDGASPATHTVEVWSRLYTFVMTGRLYVTLSGINTFAGLINSYAAAYFTVQNSNLKYLWHYADLAGFNTVIDPYGAGYGLVITGPGNVVINNTIGPTSNYALVMLSTTTSLVQNNVIYGCSYAPYFRCIHIGSNSATTATANNIIQNTGFYSGDIMAYMGEAVNFYYNDFYQSGLQRCDFGTIYCYNIPGRGSQIAYNYVHDSYSPLWITKYGSKQFAGANGIYVDNGGSNFQIFRNVVWGTSSDAFQINGQYTGLTDLTANVTYAYNTAFGNAGGSTSQPMSNILFKNNLITGGFVDTPINPSITYTNNLLTGTLDQNYIPLPGSALLIAATRMGAPYDAQIPGLPNPAIGAKDPTQPDFLPGAYVRTIDIPSLIVSCPLVVNSAANCTITNIPIGRKLPLSFQMAVTTSPIGVGNCTQSYSYSTNLASGFCPNVPVANVGIIYVRLYSNTAWIATAASFILKQV